MAKKLSDLIPEGRVFLGISGNDWESVLGELAECMARAGAIPDERNDVATDVASALLHRERMLPTAIGNGVAIPHAKLPAVPKTVAALGVSERGIDGACRYDDEPVSVFFVILSPTNDPGGHLEALSIVARRVRSNGLVDAIRRASNKDEVLEAIARAK